MKKAFSSRRRRVEVACCGAVCLLLAAGGAWAVRRGHTEPPKPAAAAAAGPAAVLDALPKTVGNSPVDGEIGKWAAKARAAVRDDRSWVNLGDALMQKVRESADYRYYGHAEAAYRQALALNDRNADAMAGLAWVHGGRHQFPESIEWARKAIALDGRNSAAYGILGDAQVERGEYDAAFVSYQKMLDIRPDIASYSRGAHLLFLTGDARKGMWLMARAVKAGGPYAENTAWCRTQLALMLFNEGALVPAEQVLRDALKATPDYHHALSAMGKIKAARGDYAAAIGFYRKALAITREHDTLVALGDLHRLTGDRDGAEKWYAEVEALHRRHDASGDRHDHLQMARFYADHDRNLTQAMRLAEEHKNSDNVYEADTLAWCYYKNGDYAAAETAIRRALKHNTPDARILYHAGMIFAKTGDVVGAKKHLYRALSLNPRFSPIDAPAASATLAELGQPARTGESVLRPGGAGPSVASTPPAAAR